MSEIITGCIEPGGSVTFTEGICEYLSGCLVKNGIHAGQIEITIDGPCCTGDTYYACLDKLTGKFQATIPEICCEKLFGCGGCGDGTNCTEVHTPHKITLDFSGFVDCGCVEISGFSEDFTNNALAQVLNGQHTLYNNKCVDDLWWGASTVCQWSALVAPFVQRRTYSSTDCTGTPTLINCSFNDIIKSGIVMEYRPGSGVFITSLVLRQSGPISSCGPIFQHSKNLFSPPEGDCWTYWQTARENELGDLCVGDFISHAIFGDSGQVLISIPADAIDLGYYPSDELPC